MNPNCIYEVKTYWGYFRLDEGAYEDYLKGKLWITWMPREHSQAKIPAAPPVHVSDEAVALYNKAEKLGVWELLQTAFPYEAFELSECINLQKEHSIKSIQKTIDVIAYAPDKSETSTELFEKKFHFSDDTFEAPDYMPTIDVSYSVTLINEFDEYLKRILNRADEIVAVIESDQESLQIPITEIQQSVYEKTGIIVNIINSKTTVVGLIKKTFSLAKSILTFDDESEDEGDIEPQPHLESVPT